MSSKAKHKVKQEAKINETVGEIMIAAPILIDISNEKTCEIDSNLLCHLNSSSARYDESDWIKLFSLLVVARAPNVIVSVGPVVALPLRAGELGIWIHELSTERRHLQWCFTVYRPSDTAVMIYAIGAVIGEQKGLSAVANSVGTLPHMLSATFHQELADSSEILYHDAILFDMFVDIAMGEFTPHQHHANDGLGIQLEIVQALRKLQIEAAAAGAMRPNKRRRTLEERLTKSSMKQEIYI